MQCSKLDTILRQCFNLICLSTSCLQQFQRGILIPAHIKTTALQDTRIKSVLLQFFMGHNTVHCRHQWEGSSAISAFFECSTLMICQGSSFTKVSKLTNSTIQQLNNIQSLQTFSSRYRDLKLDFCKATVILWIASAAARIGVHSVWI